MRFRPSCFGIVVAMMSVLFVAISLLSGCSPQEKESAKKDPSGIFGKKTDEIGEFDPAANRDVKVEDGTDVNIVTGAVGAYGGAVRTIAKLKIQDALNKFYAFEGRYPKDHDEFMSKVIKANKIQLPVPPTTQEYQYDVENHELIVVMKEKE